jgi:hypothetical protein
MVLYFIFKHGFIIMIDIHTKRTTKWPAVAGMESNELTKKAPITRSGFIDEHGNITFHHQIAPPETQPFKLAVSTGSKEWEDLAEKFDMGRSPVHVSRCLTNLSTRECGRRNVCTLWRLRITMLHLRDP